MRAKQLVIAAGSAIAIILLLLAIQVHIGISGQQAESTADMSALIALSSSYPQPAGDSASEALTLGGSESGSGSIPQPLEGEQDSARIELTFDIQRPRSADRSSRDALWILRNDSRTGLYSLEAELVVGAGDSASFTWNRKNSLECLVAVWRSSSTWAPPIMLCVHQNEAAVHDSQPMQLGFEELQSVHLMEWNAILQSQREIHDLHAVEMRIPMERGDKEVEGHLRLDVDLLYSLVFDLGQVEALIVESGRLDLPSYFTESQGFLSAKRAAVDPTLSSLVRSQIRFDRAFLGGSSDPIHLPKGSFVIGLQVQGKAALRSKQVNLGDDPFPRRLLEQDWIVFPTGAIQLFANSGLNAQVVPESVTRSLMDSPRGSLLYEYRDANQPLRMSWRFGELQSFRSWQTTIVDGEGEFRDLPAPAHYTVLLEDDSIEPPIVKSAQVVSLSPGEIVEIDLRDLQPVKLEVEVEGLAKGEGYSISIWEPFGYWNPVRKSESRWTREAIYSGEPEAFGLHPATYEIMAVTSDGRESNRIRVTLARGQEAQTVRLTIPSSLTLPVQLVLNSGQRIAGASVQLDAMNSFASQHVRLDQNLRGEVNLPAGVYNCRAEVSFDSYPVEIPMDEIDLAAALVEMKRSGEDTYKLHLAVEKIHVEVVDAHTEQPIPNANISLVPVSEDIPASAIAWTTLERYPRLSNATNESGVADVYAPTGQQLAVLTNAADYATDITLITPKEVGSKRLRIELSKWDTEVMVTVRDVDEVVVPGARVGPVVVDGPDGHFTIPWQGVTDQLGRVMLKTRKNTHTAFYVSGPHRDREIPTRKRVFRSQLAGPFLIDSESPEPINVVLAYGSDLTVELTGGEAPSRGNVPLSLHYGEDLPGVSESFHDLIDARTDSGGRFAWYGLPPGPVRVILGTPDAPLAEREITLEPNQRHRLEIELPASAHQ